jgi:mono/diheme cytochrome c family protein
VRPGRLRRIAGVAAAACLSAGAAGSASGADDASGSRALAGMSPKSLYLLRCSGCHRPDGQGAISAGVPPFAGFMGPLTRDPMGRTYVTHVPGIAGSGLSNAQVAEVLNYVLEDLSAEGPEGRRPFSEAEVARLRAQSIPDVVAYRRGVVARLAKQGVPAVAYPWP